MKTTSLTLTGKLDSAMFLKKGSTVQVRFETGHDLNVANEDELDSDLIASIYKTLEGRDGSACDCEPIWRAFQTMLG